MNCPTKTLRVGDIQQAKGDSPDRVHSDQMVLGTVRWEADPVRGSQMHSKLSWLKGGSHQAQVCSDQMVLVMARREAGPHERWLKTLKGGLENNSRKPRGPSRELAW